MLALCLVCLAVTGLLSEFMQLGLLSLVLTAAPLMAATALQTAVPVTPVRATKLRELATAAVAEDDTLDCPGIVWLEHLNLLVGPREESNAFFCGFLGCVPEPGRSWHVNLGSQQFHLGEAPRAGLEHVLTGSVCLAVPSLDAMRTRVAAATRALGHTRFAVADNGDHLLVTCPAGSNYVCFDADPPAAASVPAAEAGTAVPKMVTLHMGLDESLAVRACGHPGIRWVEFRCRAGTARRVGLFYEEMLGCRVRHSEDACVVSVGPGVCFIFHELAGAPLTEAQERAQAGPGSHADGGEGLHCCVYVERFKECFERLDARGLVATNPRFRRLDECDSYAQAHASRTLRFSRIIDLETGEELLELEHEVRATRHFQFFKRVHYPPGSGL